MFDLLLPHLEALQQSASALAELDLLVNLATGLYPELHLPDLH
ncbi:hypothetical protein ACLB1N_31870 [Escherichia coli]